MESAARADSRILQPVRKTFFVIFVSFVVQR